MHRLKTVIKKNILAGLLITIPAGLTFFLLSFVNSKVDQALSPVIIETARFAGIPLPQNFSLPGLGLVVIVLLIFLVGLATTNFLGKKIVAAGDFLLYKIPFVRTIYISIKKIVETFSQTGAPTFKKALLLEYPRPGLRTLGIICCDTKGEIASRRPEDLVTVFVPTTPNPTSGYTIMVPREQITPLNMPIDDGLKMIISLGMFNPKEKGKAQ